MEWYGNKNISTVTDGSVVSNETYQDCVWKGQCPTRQTDTVSGSNNTQQDKPRLCMVVTVPDVVSESPKLGNSCQLSLSSLMKCAFNNELKSSFLTNYYNEKNFS